MPEGFSDEQRYDEDDDAEYAEDALRDGAEDEAYERAACCSGGPSPVVSRAGGDVLGGGSGYAAYFAEVLAEEDAADGADEETEEGSDAEEEGAGQSADEATYSAAGSAPLARPKSAGPVSRTEEVNDKGEEGEEAQKNYERDADHLEARDVGVDQRCGKDKGHARQAGEHGAQEPEKHHEERDPEYRLAEVRH